MRRAMLAALGATALALTSPGAALAHHGHHHKSRSKAHHARVHFEHFGAHTSVAPPNAGAPSGSQVKTDGAPTLTGEDAGTIASFENEVLTITLKDGSTVSGKVTDHTKIECITTTATSGDEEGSSDDKGSGDDKQSGEDESGESQDRPSGEDGGDSKDDDGEATGASSETPCDTSALKPGAIVREAELRVGSSGSEFESIELVM